MRRPLSNDPKQVVGRSDKDYQKLRIERAGVPDDEDDPAAPTPTVVTPAPAAE